VLEISHPNAIWRKGIVVRMDWFASTEHASLILLDYLVSRFQIALLQYSALRSMLAVSMEFVNMNILQAIFAIPTLIATVVYHAQMGDVKGSLWAKIAQITLDANLVSVAEILMEQLTNA